MVRDSNGTATGALRGWGEGTTDLPADRNKDDEDEGQGRRARSRSREGRWSRGREVQKNEQVRRGGAGKGDAWRSRDRRGKGAGKAPEDFGRGRPSEKGARGGRRGGGGKQQGGDREKELPSEKDLDQALNAYFGKENPAATTTHNVTVVDSEAEKKLKEARAKRFGLQGSELKAGSEDVKEKAVKAAPGEARQAAPEAEPAAAPEANEVTAVNAESGKDASEDAKRLEREKRFGKVPAS